MRHSVFYFVSLGFIFGIGIGGSFSENNFASMVLFLTAVFAGGFSMIGGGIFSHKMLKIYSVSFLVSISLFSASIGSFYIRLFLQKNGDELLRKKVGAVIEMRGKVVDDPVHAELKTKIVVEIDEVKSANIFQKIKQTKVLVSDYLFSNIEYGDYVSVSGIIKKPEPFETDSGSIFQYDKYLAKDQIYYTSSLPNISVLKHGGNPVKKILYFVKHKFIKKLNQTIPYPESSLAAGLTVAGKGALPPDVLDDFNRSGTMQVVVLSGFNVTIVAETFIALFSFLPKIVASCFGMGSIILFTILAGGTATTVVL